MMRRKVMVAVGGGLLMLLVALVVGMTLAQPAGQPRALATATSVPSPTATPNLTATPWTGENPALVPARLVIPRMRLDAQVIPVGATPQGAMSTPHCANAKDPICGEVYWWSGGVVPGANGNAVIAGHLNRPDASPASFANLDQLRIGDQVQITAANSAILSFQVVLVERVSAYVQGANNPIINEIFGPAATPNLNLITCIGDWDGATFNQRLVVHLRLLAP